MLFDHKSLIYFSTLRFYLGVIMFPLTLYQSVEDAELDDRQLPVCRVALSACRPHGKHNPTPGAIKP